jgi:hypothetical protein
MNWNTETIPLQIAPVVNGRKWHVFDAEFETPDGKFSFYFYALSFEHAAYVLEELKATAKLGGQIEGTRPA